MTEIEQEDLRWYFVPSILLFKGVRAGMHGYLIFEDAEQAENSEYVDGIRLGELMVETNTPVLVLNACRSAHAETESSEEEDTNDVQAADDRPARTFGLLAQEAMDTGVAGVVAMRYNVYVVTAAQFVADLYAALGRGQNGRLADARDYAAAALRNFEQFGPAAATEAERTRELLAQIEVDLE